MASEANELARRSIASRDEMFTVAPDLEVFMQDLHSLTDDDLRAEARRRGYELHSVQFSQAAQSALRELEGMRRRIDELVVGLQPQTRTV